MLSLLVVEELQILMVVVVVVLVDLEQVQIFQSHQLLIQLL
jgi:hypothetical protein